MTLFGSSAVPPWRTESMSMSSDSSGRMRLYKINYNVMLKESDSLRGLTAHECALNRWMLVSL